jgi:hypothetical protein
MKLGLKERCVDGLSVGFDVGLRLRLTAFCANEGFVVGIDVGMWLGLKMGCVDGSSVGVENGIRLGITDGANDGFDEGINI